MGAILLGASLLGAGCGPVSLGRAPAGLLSAPAVAPPAAGGAGETVLQVRWRKQLTEPGLIEYKPQEFSTATSDGKRVFIGARGGFFALDPRDGRVLWRKPIPGGVAGRPLYLPDGDTVYVGGSDGALHALAARTGTERWVYRTKGPIQGAPVFDDGTLYFRNGENRLYAVDAQSGAWRWQYERESPDAFTIRGSASPLAVGGRIYAGFSDGYLVALNARTGDVVWARSLAGDAQRFVDVDATPALVGGTLYVSSYSGGVRALDPADGSLRWQYDVEGAGSVLVDGDRVYFAAPRAGLHCLDGRGNLVWRQSLARQGELSVPVIVRTTGGGARHLLLSASDAGTYVIDPATGRLEQFFRPGHGVTAPAYSDGRQVYVLTNAGFFYAFALLG